MINKEQIKGKTFGTAATVTTGLLVVAVAALFAISMAHEALGAGNMATLKGEVVAVDSYGKTLTLRSIEPTEHRKGDYTFSLDRMTDVTKCVQNKPIENIAVGDKASVTFHEEEGNLVADAIDIAPVYLACYDQ